MGKGMEQRNARNGFCTEKNKIGKVGKINTDKD